MEILFILAVLIFLSAFFSGSETALFSLSKVRVKRLQHEKVKRSKLLAQLLSSPRRLIVTILIGNMLANILASAIASSLSITLFGEKGVGISIIAMTLLILTFGEITPKLIAIRNSEKISLFVVPYINIFSKLTLPVRKVLQVITDPITPMFSKKMKTQKQDLTEEELKTAVELARKGGALNVKEEEMIKSVIRFGDKTARDVLIPPKRIAACEITTPLKTIRSIITNKELSRMPIFENKLDNIIGILYAKDLFVADLKGPFALRDILREPFYISSAIKLDDLLREFRAHRVHMALVKDPKGKFIGLVTLQDLLEEIMGQIRDIKA